MIEIKNGRLRASVCFLRRNIKNNLIRGIADRAKDTSQSVLIGVLIGKNTSFIDPVVFNMNWLFKN